MLRSLVILLLAVPLASAAPVPKELKRNDAQAILGTWEMVRSSLYAKDPAPPTATILWRFDADGSGVVNNSEKYEIGYKLLPADSPNAPKNFDFRWVDSHFKGLYRLDGDTLKIAVDSDGGKVRAGELGPGKNLYYWEFKRLGGEKK